MKSNRSNCSKRVVQMPRTKNKEKGGVLTFFATESTLSLEKLSKETFSWTPHTHTETHRHKRNHEEVITYMGLSVVSKLQKLLSEKNIVV